jgi:hypothetical protein
MFIQGMKIKRNNDIGFELVLLRGSKLENKELD